MENKAIDDKVKYCVSESMQKVNRWMIGIALGFLSIIITTSLANNRWIGRMEERGIARDKQIGMLIEAQKEFIESQSETNDTMKESMHKMELTFTQKFNGLLANDFVIGNHLQREDPNFKFPTSVTRGSKTLTR